MNDPPRTLASEATVRALEDIERMRCASFGIADETSRLIRDMFEVVDSGVKLDVSGVQDIPTIEDDVGPKLSYKQLQRLNPAERIAYARARTKWTRRM